MLRGVLREAVKDAMLNGMVEWRGSVVDREHLIAIRRDMQEAIQAIFLDVIGVELSWPTLEELRVEQSTVSPDRVEITLPWSIKQWMTDP